MILGRLYFDIWSFFLRERVAAEAKPSPVLAENPRVRIVCVFFIDICLIEIVFLVGSFSTTKSLNLENGNMLLQNAIMSGIHILISYYFILSVIILRKRCEVEINLITFLSRQRYCDEKNKLNFSISNYWTIFVAISHSFMD